MAATVRQRSRRRIISWQCVGPDGLQSDSDLSCIPTCNEETHGYLLLLSIDGTDTVMTCELSNRVYDWLGMAALGGFVGENVAALVSAVISGAAGSYILKLMRDASVGVDLEIQPGQLVVVSGDERLAAAPVWGTGGFSVRQSGSH